MDLIFATNNSHKLQEIKAVAGENFRIISLAEAGINTEIPEDFESLEENAAQKAQFIFDRTGINCFADDTGLEVHALDNQPGVYSARYSRLDDNFNPEMEINKANILKLLSELNSKKDRSARFRTVISLIINGEKLFFEGIVKGEILTAPIGDKGFGYDPVFQPENYQLSFAQMNLEEKNRISHRARAVKKLVDYLRRI